MLKKETHFQGQMEFINIEDLIPDNHLLRKIDKYIDFSFILDKTVHLYCLDNGRPPVHPITLFKMLFLGYLFGIRSERQLVKEIQVNVAYRWFLGFGLGDKIPDHSVFSQNRRRRFQDSSIFEEIFTEIVRQGIDLGFVDGKILYTDSTHLKASANKQKFEPLIVKRTPKDFLDELDNDIKLDRIKHGKKPLKPKKKQSDTDDDGENTKEIKSSTTDPDSGFMTRDRKPKGFFYLDHRTVDSKHNFITDVHITPGNVHDSSPYLDRLNVQMDKFNFDVKAVGLDAGYFTANICKNLIQKEIMAVIAYRRPNGKNGFFKKGKFKFDKEKNVYICPANSTLHYRTTNRRGYREYISNPKTCKTCAYLGKCTESQRYQKVVTRHVWEDYKELVNGNRLTSYGKDVYKRRKETVEISFANAKQLHGYRHAKYRGIERVKEQAFMTAIVQNIKKIAMIRWKNKILTYF